MGIGGRLRQLERAAAEHVATFACPECGEAFRYAGDPALDLVAAERARAACAAHEEDPVVSRVMDHPHEALRTGILRDIPAFRDAR